MTDSSTGSMPTVTLDVRVPLSVTFEQVGSRINFVLEEQSPTIATDKTESAEGSAKYELYEVDA